MDRTAAHQDLPEQVELQELMVHPVMLDHQEKRVSQAKLPRPLQAQMLANAAIAHKDLPAHQETPVPLAKLETKEPLDNPEISANQEIQAHPDNPAQQDPLDHQERQATKDQKERMQHLAPKEMLDHQDLLDQLDQRDHLDPLEQLLHHPKLADLENPDQRAHPDQLDLLARKVFPETLDPQVPMPNIALVPNALEPRHSRHRTTIDSDDGDLPPPPLFTYSSRFFCSLVTTAVIDLGFVIVNIMLICKPTNSILHKHFI